MYLKVRVKAGEYSWRVFGEIRNLSYSLVEWTREEYNVLCRGMDYQVDLVACSETDEQWENKETRVFVYAVLTLKSGGYRIYLWDTIGYLLNEEGKTIEVISTSS